ncbi:hypothetical protein AG1IA_09307 [Rhizoctonia solani AG-1 IA]|uniref:Uncharacterized protein n=1 Tax=Thanatephorus cucumeris (strain AG1-IA) TaxID=983506 RepID=L8WJX4_THACA|nr:hypothetical protein AG1IA_09307 [Rhizoctonia solani AG-1 IA]
MTTLKYLCYASARGIWSSEVTPSGDNAEDT